MKSLLFSAEGRINRWPYWKGALILIGFAIIVGMAGTALAQVIPGDPSEDGGYHVTGVKSIPYLILAFGYFGVSIWAGICLGIKRYHDRGKPGVWVLIQFVPIIGPVWYLIEAGCLRGTVGANPYGPDPLRPPTVTG